MKETLFFEKIFLCIMAKQKKSSLVQKSRDKRLALMNKINTR